VRGYVEVVVFADLCYVALILKATSNFACGITRLLYASDRLALHSEGTLYDPELMWEVAQIVARENLKVDTVFAMHQGPTS
jgi:hypothetical protein